MRSNLKTELLKLLTVRSTYILTALVVLATALISFYILGRQQVATLVASPSFIYDSLYTTISFFATFSAIIAILLITHEYRYNMIGYTLTASTSRLKVIAAKALVLIGYTVVVGLVVALITYVGVRLGVASIDLTIGVQQVGVWEGIWRLGSYTLAYTLIGLILGLLIRGVVGAIVVFFTFPIVEQILSLLLKDNTKYLPFQALDRVANTGLFDMAGPNPLSHTAALGVFSVYFLTAAVVATVLFVRRDAN